MERQSQGECFASPTPTNQKEFEIKAMETLSKIAFLTSEILLARNTAMVNFQNFREGIVEHCCHPSYLSQSWQKHVPLFGKELKQKGLEAWLEW
jgi:hypothetical protein